MNFLLYCPNTPNLELKNALKLHAERFGAELVNIDQLPEQVGMHEILCLCSKSLDIKNLRPLTYSSYQYLALVDGAECTKAPFILRTGGNIFQRSEIDKESNLVTQNLRAVIENMKLKDLAYHLSLKELTLIRRIYGLVQADKKTLAQEVYGASSETTLDVNLARLRKKAADPKAGADFFRILTQKRKLYLASVLNDYNIDDLRESFDQP